MANSECVHAGDPGASSSEFNGLLVSPEVVPSEKVRWFDQLPPAPAAYGLPAVRQDCVQYDQPLVEVGGGGICDAYCVLGILPSRRMMVRSEVAKRLVRASRLLPDMFGLTVLDGWRSVDEQQSQVAHYGDGAADEGFVAPVSDDGCRPPHTTGGTVDLTLSWNGEPLALGTDFDSFDDEAASDAFEEPGADVRVRLLRRGFAYAMSAVGFVNYELEWWHWSYGDDVWAHAMGRPALYEIVGETHVERSRSAGLCLD